MPTSRISSRARSRAFERLWPRCAIGPSAIWSPTRITGFRAVIGSWKIIAMLAPRTSCSRLWLADDEILALEHHLAADDLAGVGKQAEDRPQRHALATSRLADEAERLAREELERRPVDRVYRAAG